METEIIEGNKLIAEFMGWKNILSKEECESNDFGFHVAQPLGPNMYGTWPVVQEDLKYHSSWDWLIPCIGKISNQCEEPEELDDLKYALLTNNIEEAWKFVVSYLTIS